MFKSIFGTLDKPKGAAPLPLGLVDLIVLNAVIQAASIGYLSALFRRDVFSPLQGITTRLAYPVITDLVALTVLGFFALALTTLKSAPEGTRLDRAMAAGAPLWLGYALGLVWLRVGFVLANLPPTSEALAPVRWLFDYLPAYRGVTELSRWHPNHWPWALVFVIVCGVLGWLYARRSEESPQRLHRVFRLSLIVAVCVSVPAASRAYSSWRPAVAGDTLAGRLIATPQIGALDWQPEGLRGRITLVEFWTTWCGACKRLLPKLNALKNTIPSPAFEVLLVNVEGRGNPPPELVNKVRKYKAQRAPDLPVLIDRGAWSDAVGITVYPTMALIGGDGRLLNLWSGTPNMSDVEASIRSALEAQSGL
jgi:thiol-disulfide isomerase/thioredoxin